MRESRGRAGRGNAKMNEVVSPERLREELLDAILPHVVFDGWKPG